MSNNMRGIWCKLIATLLFTLMSALVTLLTDTIPLGEVVFFRCYLALIPLVIWQIYKKNLAALYKTPHFRKHLLRGSNSFIGMSFGFLALYYISLTDQVALLYAWPLIVIPLAVLILKEQVGVYRWSAVVIGLLGVLVILYPYLTNATRGENAVLGAIFCIIAAFSYAFGAIIVRSLTGTESFAATVFFFCIICGAYSLFTIPFTPWVMPTLKTGAILLCIGVLGGLGQMFMTEGFRRADATLLAPFEYTSILWASLFGFLLHGQLPTFYTVIGSIIVIFAGLIVIIRERYLNLKRINSL
jgi:drug/metabolite transporter (DMT)-like permease